MALGRVALLLVLAFSILPVLSNAAGISSFYCATNNGLSSDIGGCVNSAIPYVVIGLMLSFAIVSLTYLIGEVFGFPALKGWYKNELWEATKSVLVVLVIFAAILILGDLAISICTGNQYCTLTGQQLAGSTTTTQVETLYGVGSGFIGNEYILANDSYNNLIGISMGIEYLKSVSTSTYTALGIPPSCTEVSVLCVTANFGSDQSPFQSSILEVDPTKPPLSILKDMLNLLVFPMLLILGVQNYLFYTIIVIGLGVLLPLGLVFRAIPFLRGIGGTLIALAIAASVIYPGIIAVFNAGVASALTSITSPYYTPVPTSGCIVFSLCGAVSLLGGGTFGLPEPGGSDGYYAGQAAFFDGSLMPVLNDAFWYQTPVAEQFVLFVIDLIMAVVLTTNIAKLLGGNIRLGIGKMTLA